MLSCNVMIKSSWLQFISRVTILKHIFIIFVLKIFPKQLWLEQPVGKVLTRGKWAAANEIQAIASQTETWSRSRDCVSNERGKGRQKWSHSITHQTSGSIMINYLPRCYPIAQQMPRRQLKQKKKKSNFLKILNESQTDLKKLIPLYFKKNIFTTRDTNRNQK